MYAIRSYYDFMKSMLLWMFTAILLKVRSKPLLVV